MDTTEDENVAMLLSMGFPSVEQVRRALQMSKNDINEAVNLLTSEGSLTSYSTFDDLTGMDVSVQTTSPYQEKEEEEEDDAFPMGYLYKLESTVFTEQWSIPYRRNEPLGKCLIAAARLVRNGQYEADEHCQRFVQRCLPEVFRKLLTASAVRNWNASIQQGVYDMLVLYLELIVSLLRAGAVPCSLMNAVLPLAFDMDVEYHQKNKNQDWDETGWETQLSIELFAKPLSSGPFQEPYGKLVDLINCFGALGGFQLLGEMFQQSDDLTCEDMGALLGPLGICAPFLVLSTIKPILSPCLKVALERLHSLPAKELKEKNGGHALQLVNSLKQLVNILEPEQEEAVNTLRLEIILRMLRTPNFSSRIIALKELLRVMEESEVTGPAVRVSQPIDRASLLLWMEENQILHLVLEGNTDQVQYMEKVKNVVEYMGPDLREDELQRMWKLQDAGNSHTVENLHAVLAGAVSRLSPKHIQCLTSLIHKSWTTGEDRARERLITLIGRMGREVKESQPMEEFLQLLWSLALDQLLPPSLVDLALQEHQAIVQEASNREQLSKTYVAKSVDEIQDGKHVVPALKHLGHMAHCIVHGNSSYFKPNKSALSELSQTHGLIRLITDSVKTVAGLKDSQEPKYSIQEVSAL
ncbi:unnamed protein product [Darwinula stevensoni]|uniref:UBA domain-containing protein n=1 Tax=Darwinula stevensoni TaxID=69355 RepID=A0A7R8X5P2_9CRUS|nr:unnamed protein product [Darwinula stevensoni]CAG0887292.1 unnamed protein product [Darwinula stevensoni]